MKLNKTILVVFIALIVVAALYRVIPGRPYGFAPQIAMALFAGMVIKDRKWAFALPLFSMVLSDLIFEILYHAGLSHMQGFYEGQIINYCLFAGLTAVGFLFKKTTVVNVILGSVISATLYFVLSNTFVWMSDMGGLQRPKTFYGWLLCLGDGVPFYKNSLYGTLFFAALFFTGYHYSRAWLSKRQLAK